ncbi:ABC transporter substrate-binding protein [Aeromicrobium ginsengisoli]|uniref:Extracellular solute-binding protein n=1 Tax=Aeromicrobium ginsengisoli TaxID=363867 RepID=A0A5M4FE95_9ACTN|nr:extracellular solute-binding protein [Aeromicrobium ginsengisoli]KAA1397665.1 extracellular solute-binding protein [Aeromicrobium ginsengisoli]
MKSSSRTFRAMIPVSVAALVVLAGCAGGGSSDSDKPNDVSTKVTSKPVTLNLAYTDDPPTNALIDAFRKKHPNITIKAQQTPFSDYVKSIKLSMASSTPPDIAEYNPGAMRALVPAGLIYDLEPYAKAYSWNDSFPASSLEVLSSDKKAKEYGTGGLYAVPGALSVLGVYYNKDLVSKAGISETPATLADFEADLKKVKDSGTTPFSLGGLQVGGFQLWNALTNSLGDVTQYRDWVYGKSGSSIETAGAKEAAQKVSDWVKAGYVPQSANATADSDAQADFVNGKSAYLITGNWAASAIQKEMGDDVGFFLFPQKTADADKIASGASVAFSISSKTKHPNEAAAFLDFMSSPEAAKVQVESGFMPVDTETAVETSGVLADISGAFKSVVEDNGIVPFPDFAAPDMIDKLTAGVQGLLSDKTTAPDYLASLQESWNSFHE